MVEKKNCDEVLLIFATTPKIHYFDINVHTTLVKCSIKIKTAKIEM